MLKIACAQAVTIHIHTQSRFNNYTAHSLNSILIMAASVMDVMKIGNSVPRMVIETTSLAFWGSVLTITPQRFPDATALPMSNCM